MSDKTREEKLKTIRRTFASQPLGGWTSEEVKYFMKHEFGIDFRAAKDLTDEQIDAIYADLEAAKMI